MLYILASEKAMFTAYFDESGSPDEGRALVVAGYVARDEQWAEFDREWKELLAQEAIALFHMRDFAHSRREFERWKGDERRRARFLERLIGIIRRRVRKSFAHAVILEDYRRVDATYHFHENFGYPYSEFYIGSFGTEFTYSPSGKYLVTTDFKNAARIWDTSSGREVLHVQHEITDKENGFQNMLDCAAFSSDEHLLATGSWDHTARVWDISTGKEVARFTHESHLRGVSFSPDGRYLSTETEDEIVRVWNISNREEITRFNGQDDSIPSLNFSPDGRFLIKLTEGATVSSQLWNPTDLMKEACGRITRNLTLEEWSQYFGDEPYQRTCSNLSEAPPPTTDDTNAASQENQIDDEPNDPLAYYQRGWDRIDKKDYDGAIADLTEAIKRNPKDADAYSSRAIAYGNKRMVDEALADFRKAEALGGDRARIYTNRGSLFSDLGDTDKALAEYQAATKADPRFFGSFFNRAQLYIKQKKYSEAISDLTVVIELEPNNTEALHRRGLSYHSTGNNKQAIADFRMMLLRATNEQTRQDARRHLLELGEPMETIQPVVP